MDITRLILDDHHEQRRLFAFIDEIPDDDVTALGGVWHRLSTFLETHAKAEETWFYPQLLKAGLAAGEAEEAKSETLDAIKDHNEIRDAIIAAGQLTVGSEEWRKAVAKANKANAEHMEEEEREGLTLFRQTASLDQRHELAVKFITFETEHLDGVQPINFNPEKWVKAHEK